MKMSWLSVHQLPYRGHVGHGKTTLLDTFVALVFATGEAGEYHFQYRLPNGKWQEDYLRDTPRTRPLHLCARVLLLPILLSWS